MKMGSLYNAPSQIIEAFSGKLSTTTPSLPNTTMTEVHVKEKRTLFGDKRHATLSPPIAYLACSAKIPLIKTYLF